MPLKVVTGFLYAFILLISFEFIAPAFSHATPVESEQQACIHSENHKTLFISSLYEKTEEERTEEEKEKFISIELADFSQLATLLSQSHTPNAPPQSPEQAFDPQPPLFKLFCVYLL